MYISVGVAIGKLHFNAEVLAIKGVRATDLLALRPVT